MRNALTVDVEDYFHVAAFSRQIDPATWDRFPLRVEHNTHRLLEMFADRKVRATFFVLGWVAERCSSLVRAIADHGHEVACHGYSHQLIYGQTPAVFREETVRAKACLEDQAQCPVLSGCRLSWLLQDFQSAPAGAVLEALPITKIDTVGSLAEAA